MNEQLDARGLSCPQPVLLTRKKLAEMGSGLLEVLVDTGTARDNIERAALAGGWTVEVRERGDGFALLLSRE